MKSITLLALLSLSFTSCAGTNTKTQTERVPSSVNKIESNEIVLVNTRAGIKCFGEGQENDVRDGERGVIISTSNDTAIKCESFIKRDSRPPVTAR